MKDLIEVWLLVLALSGSTHIQVHQDQAECEKAKIEILEALPKGARVGYSYCMPVIKHREFKI